MNIIVLAGGLSPERDVSLSSGLEVRNALRKKGHRAVMIDVFLGIEQPIPSLDAVFDWDIAYPGGSGISHAAPDLAAIRQQRQDQSPALIGPQVLDLCRAADIAFLALHGAIGENGKLQATLDIFGIPYTGSGSLGSAVAMDKAMSKQLFIHSNLLTPPARLIRRGDLIDPASLTYPCMVKPCSGGSSVGATLVNEILAMDAAVSLAFSYEDKILIEDFIKGREFAVAVLGRQALPVIEILPKGAFFDYVGKYQADACLEICPARLEPAIASRMQALALKAYDALELSVFARMDFILADNGDIYLLEANTLPGMTQASLLPKEAAAAGISYPDMCQLIVDYSLAKY